MAIRTKTVEYAAAMNIGIIATGVDRDFATFTCSIPETTGRVFQSVHMEVFVMDNVATAASPTAFILGVNFDGGAFDSATVTQTLGNSGENASYLVSRDITTAWGAAGAFTAGITSRSVGLRVRCTGASTINASAKVVITYRYDDTSPTLLKTVRIPIDGNIGNLGTTFANVGGADQIPALNTFLPEAAKVYRSIFFQADVTSGATAAAATGLTLRFDGATSLADTSWAWTLNSAVFHRRIDLLTAVLNTAATANVEALVTSTSVPYSCFSGVLYVTYEFTPVENTTLAAGIDAVVTSFDVADASTWPTAYPFTVQVDDERMSVTARTSNTITVTRGFDGSSAAAHSSAAPLLATIMNSLAFTCVDEAGWIGGTVTGDKGRFQRDILVQEPGAIALRQSGVQMHFNDAGAVSVDLRVGAQPSRVYVQPATQRCGGMSIQRRIDAGAVGGAGFTLASRGRATLTVDYFTTSGTAGSIGSNASAVCLLNYVSGQSARGGGDHAHTTVWATLPYATGGLVLRRTQAAANVKTPSWHPDEDEYYLVGASWQVFLTTTGTTSNSYALVINAEVQTGEAEQGGWRTLYSGIYTSDPEAGPSIIWVRGRTEFKRWPTDPEGDVGHGGRLNLATARDWRFDCSLASVVWQAFAYVTSHSMVFEKVITISGSAGGTVNVEVIRKDTGETLWSGSRVGNGTVTAQLFENTDTKITLARESGVLLGRSDDWT